MIWVCLTSHNRIAKVKELQVSLDRLIVIGRYATVSHGSYGDFCEAATIEEVPSHLNLDEAMCLCFFFGSPPLSCSPPCFFFFFFFEKMDFRSTNPEEALP